MTTSIAGEPSLPSETKNELKDLSITPEGAKEAIQQAYDNETELLEAIAGEMPEPDLGEMILRSQEFQKKLESGEKRDGKKITAPVVPTEGRADEVKATTPTKAKDKKKPGWGKPAAPVTGKGGARKIAAAARMAIKTRGPGPSAAPTIKPGTADPVVEEKDKTSPVEETPREDPKGKGKEKEEEPSVPELPPAVPEELAREDAEWKSDGDVDADLFPVNDSRDVSGDTAEYDAFSHSSSVLEAVSSDVDDVKRQVRNCVDLIKTQGLRMVALEETLKRQAEDNNKFMSSALDRIRKVEREMGNKPKITVPASSTYVKSAPSPATPPPGGPSTPTETPAERLRAILEKKRGRAQ